MDSQDQRGAVSHLVKVLRRVTRIVQIVPFVYLFFLGLYLLTERALPVQVLQAVDNILAAPSFAMLGVLAFGGLLKLCAWHRAACLLPLTTKVETYVDSFVVTLTQGEVLFINILLGVSFLTFLVLAFRHFFSNGRKDIPVGNPRLL